VTLNIIFSVVELGWGLSGVATLLICSLKIFNNFQANRHGLIVSWVRYLLAEDVKLSPTNFLREVDLGRGSRPSRKSKFSGPDWKLLPTHPTSKKTIALAFMKATYSQIPYWVHFTFKVQNPIYIYMFTAIE
jgi:hypothetical protein